MEDPSLGKTRKKMAPQFAKQLESIAESSAKFIAQVGGLKEPFELMRNFAAGMMETRRTLQTAAELDCRAQDAVRHLGGAATDYIRANEARMKELATTIVATTKELAAVITATTAASDARITAMTAASDARLTRIEKNLDLLIRGLRARRRRRSKPLQMNSPAGVSKTKETRK
jgi:hypothetical protein